MTEEKEVASLRIQGGEAANRTGWPWQVLTQDIYLVADTKTKTKTYT